MWIGFVSSGFAACLAPTPLTADIVESALADGATAHGDDLVLGYLSYLRDAALDGGAPYGLVAFVRWDGAWSAVLPQEAQMSVADLVSPDGRTVLFVTQPQVEGPAPLFTVVRSDDGLRTGSCAELPFPALLNEPSYALETLASPQIELRRSGRGRLVASAEIDIDTEHPYLTWWEYRTADGGRTWGAPVRLGAEPRLRRPLAPIAAPASAEQIASIRAQVTR